MRSRQLIPLAGIALLTLAGCSEQAPPTAAPTVEPTGTESGEIGLPELPTHWTNTRPIGDGGGPVTDADLAATMPPAGCSMAATTPTTASARSRR